MQIETDPIRNLFSFYLDCLEEEDLKSLRFKKSQLNKSFILRGNSERLLAGDSVREIFAPHTFQNRIDFFEDSQRLHLGYPLCVRNGEVSPLFFIEIEIRISEDGIYSILLVDDNLLLNHHLYSSIMTPEEIVKVQKELEDDLDSFESKIGKAFEYFSADWEKCKTITFEDFKLLRDEDDLWVKNTILFKGGRSAFNAQLRIDVGTFLKYPSLFGKIQDTALGALFYGIDKTGSGRVGGLKIEVASLNKSQIESVNNSLEKTMTVVTGPPGTGKSQVAVNILANCIASKKSVLFASKNNKAVDVVYDKLSGFLKDEDWILRMGNMEKVKECRDRVMDSMHLLGGVDYEGIIQRSAASIKNSSKIIDDLLNKKKEIERCQNDISKSEEDVNELRCLVKSEWWDLFSNMETEGMLDVELSKDVETQEKNLILLSQQDGFNIFYWLWGCDISQEIE